MSEYVKCKVEGKVVTPCTGLQEISWSDSTGRKKKWAVEGLEYRSLKTFSVTATVWRVRTNTTPEGGLAFGFCPMCGVEIGEGLKAEEPA